MDLGLRGKTAVVTAASKGLGRAVAERLAEEGANVLVCSRNEDACVRLAEELSAKHGVHAVGVRADVSERDDIARLMETAQARFGGIDALLCNAGGPPSGPFLSLGDEVWERAIQTNLFSTIRLIRAVHPLMRQRGGRIVTIASSSVKEPIPGLVLSNTLRAGIAGLMKTVASEFAGDGILVNTLCPGRVATGRLQELDEARAEREGRDAADVRADIVRSIPVGRYGEPAEFAAVAAFLLSPANSYMTGSSLFVDGGMVKSL